MSTEASVDAVFASVVSTPLAVLERFAAERFGIHATATRLVAERDENVHLRAEDGREFVLKLTNPAEDPLVTGFHTDALLHIARVDRTLPVPQLVRSHAGHVEETIVTDGAPARIARLFTFMPGVPLYRAPRSALQRHMLGRCLARLDRALQGFHPVLAGHELAWDLQHAARLRPLLDEIEDPARRSLATLFLDRFERHVVPRLPELRTQVIHNDYQPYNVLVDATAGIEVTGVIDFGDAVVAPLINDVAVACAYHVDGAPRPFDHVAELLAGYTDIVPLRPVEVAILSDLLTTRMVMTVAISNWRARRQPENQAYILRNAPPAWRGLERCALIHRDDAAHQLTAACTLE